MRIDFRKSVLVPVGLVVAGTLVTSDVSATPAHASARQAPYFGVHMEAMAGPGAARLARLARERASRSGTRTRSTVPDPAPEAAAPKPAVAAAGGGDDAVWQRLRNCEAGGRYQANTGNGYYGAYQMSAGTWHSLGYGGLPHEAAPEVQDQAARKLQARSGWGQWPACSRRVGAR
jgi:hypothetical protein